MDYECYCGGAFASRADLTAHNVTEHDMTREASQRKVDAKYPLSET